MAPIQPADPAARRRALLWILLALLLGSALVLWFEQHRERLFDWLVTHPQWLYEHRGGLLLGFTASLLPMWGFCYYLWRFGARVVRDQRVPPLGVAVVRPTPVYTGPAAIRRGRLLRLMAVMLALSCVGLLVALWRVVALLAPALAGAG